MLSERRKKDASSPMHIICRVYKIDFDNKMVLHQSSSNLVHMFFRSKETFSGAICNFEIVSTAADQDLKILIYDCCPGDTLWQQKLAEKYLI